MSFLHDSVLDAALSKIRTDADALHICSAQPTDLANVAVVGLGNATPSIGAPADATPNGRKITVAAITDGSVTANGTASHWALVDTGTALLASTTLSSSQAVTSGNTFTLTAFDIRMPDAA